MGCGTNQGKKNKQKIQPNKVVVVNPNAVPSHQEKPINPKNEEEYQQVLQERGEQWDKYLKDKKHKNISKESLIDLKMKEANLKKAEELAKRTNGQFNLQYKM